MIEVRCVVHERPSGLEPPNPASELVIRNDTRKGMVVIEYQVLPGTVYDGHELIEAIKNAMNTARNW